MLSPDQYLAIALFVFALSATPGPNNVMLTAAGANFGLRRTVPHLLGVSTGLGALIALVAMGLGSLLTRYPAMHVALQIAGSVYLLYLAWRIATADNAATGAKVHAPIRFVEAFGFQFANPKVWIMGISAVGLFTEPGERYALSAATVVVVAMAVNLPSVSLWACFGTVIGRFLHEPTIRRRFNYVMGAMTAACVALVVL